MLTPKKDNTFYIQAGFVEGIIESNTIFSTIESAYTSIFDNTKEYCFVEWNGVPFLLDYKKDIPYIIKPICKLLNSVLLNDYKTILFETITTSFSLSVSKNINNQINIQATFNKVSGNHEKALNAVSEITIDKKIFLAEWKLLLEQLEKALIDSKCKIANDEDIDTFNNLKKINYQIPKRADRYLYENRINS